jgi:hypothetical protein
VRFFKGGAGRFEVVFVGLDVGDVHQQFGEARWRRSSNPLPSRFNSFLGHWLAGRSGRHQQPNIGSCSFSKGAGVEKGFDGLFVEHLGLVDSTNPAEECSLGTPDVVRHLVGTSFWGLRHLVGTTFAPAERDHLVGGLPGSGCRRR